MSNTASFTVALSVYKNDKAEDFITAIHSIYHNQTVRPDDIVLVVDGYVPDNIEEAIAQLQLEIPVLRTVRFHQNLGHGAARQAGLVNARNELVAVMDSDDIAVPERFGWQLEFMQKHPDIAVLGGNISEFIGCPENAVGRRIVPETSAEIEDYIKSRAPMNLMTVMYRKSMVQAVGGFRDWFCEEDYFLWVRLVLHGYKLYNLQKKLVDVRVGKEMYQRRGGLKYFKSEADMQWYMLQNKLISFPKFFYNVSIRFAVQVAMPNTLRSWVFQHFARS